MISEYRNETVKFLHNQIVFYTDCNKSGGGKLKNENSLDNLKDNFTTGYLSKNSRKKITNEVYTLLKSLESKKDFLNNFNKDISEKPAFITLDLPAKQAHDDYFIKRNMLNHFIIWLRTCCYVKNYIWKAEKQDNTNIHFHIIVDRHIHWELIRDKWNGILDLYGYLYNYQWKRNKNYKYELLLLKLLPVTKTTKQLKNKILQIKSSYDKYYIFRNYNKTDFLNFCQYLIDIKKDKKISEIITRIENDKSSFFSSPNSTDIHNLKRIKDIPKYIAKEITKNDKQILQKIYNKKEAVTLVEIEKIESLKVKGRLYGSSKLLKNCKNYTDDNFNTIWNFVEDVRNDTTIKQFSGDYFSVIYCDTRSLLKKYSIPLYEKYEEVNKLNYDILYKNKIIKKVKDSSTTEKIEAKFVEKIVVQKDLFSSQN
jgi:hypothetical protein